MSLLLLFRPRAPQYILEEFDKGSAWKKKKGTKILIKAEIKKELPQHILTPPHTKQEEISLVREYFTKKEKQLKEKKEISNQILLILKKLEIIKTFGLMKVPIPFNWNEKTTLDLLTTLEEGLIKKQKEEDEQILMLLTVTVD